jgi:DnaK suppressor protein
MRQRGGDTTVAAPQGRHGRTYGGKDIVMTTIADDARHAPTGPVTSRATLDDLRRALLEQQATLLQRAGEYVDDIRVLQTKTATSGQGESEHTTSGVERGLAIALEANTLAALEDIAFALARMDEGSYGVCADCRVPIPVERLFAIPHVKYCVLCQSRHEERG